MADSDHVAQLMKGSAAWNAWRAENPNIRPDLIMADLEGADLYRTDLKKADLRMAKLRGANLAAADLSEANLEAADLHKTDLRKAKLSGANLFLSDLSGADLRGADLAAAKLHEADLRGADLRGALLYWAILQRAKLNGANLHMANLSEADFRQADLSGADLSGADLSAAILIEANLSNAVLTGSDIYGISAWDVTLSEGTKQKDLIITPRGEPEVTVDNIEVAQFVYLLLHNEKIRDVIDTVGRKGVLVLGRFTEGRIAVLERLREELRKRGYLPIVFNFDKPETKDFTETVRLLAGLSRFVIADVTNPKSTPLELQATVPEIMVPFLPIIEEGEQPFSMLTDLWIKHRDWVFEPIHYSSLDALVAALDEEIIKPAEARFDELVIRKAERMKGRHV